MTIEQTYAWKATYEDGETAYAINDVGAAAAIEDDWDCEITIVTWENTDT
jgi:hypothetical protein